VSREERRRRRRKGRRQRARRRRLLVAAAVTVALLSALTVKLRLVTFAPAPSSNCSARGNDGVTTHKLTEQQAAIATTIAVTAKRLGLPNHAVTIGLATGLQESQLRNLDHGDLDSLGVFQQRPSMGWGNKRQVRDPRYSAGAFFSYLGSLPNWQSMSVNDAAQAVQRSAFPKAYGKWEPQARAMARDLTGEVAAGFTCKYSSVPVFLDRNIQRAMTAELGTTGTALSSSGLNGWTVAAWLITHAKQYGVHTVSYAGYRWTAKGGTWARAATSASAVTYT
jgi:hypothetical protein